MTPVTFPFCSKTVVSTASPAYRAWSNSSVATSRAGRTTVPRERKSPGASRHGVSGFPSCAVKVVSYGSDSTSTGLTRVARRAGAMHASRATHPVPIVTAASSRGSVG